MKVIEYGKENREVMIFLHGGGLSWWNYKTEAELLSDAYHVVLPILDGHGESDDDFSSIEKNAERIIAYIDEECNGSVKVLGGLSLGAQIVLEILSQRHDICEYAIIESALVEGLPLSDKMISSSVSLSYPLIRQKWFAKLQAAYLHIRKDMFDDYYRDTCLISKNNMISFLKANMAYRLKPDLSNNQARIRIITGEKEDRQITDSARLIHEALPQSTLEVKPGLHHGEYALNKPELYVKEVEEMINGHKD